MDQKYINQLQTTDVTFWTHWRKLVFPERSIRVTDGGEKCKNYLCFWLEVIAKCGNVNDKIFVRWQNNCFCQTNMSPRSYM